MVSVNGRQYFALALARRDGDLPKGGHEIGEGSIEVLEAGFDQIQLSRGPFEKYDARINERGVDAHGDTTSVGGFGAISRSVRTAWRHRTKPVPLLLRSSVAASPMLRTLQREHGVAIGDQGRRRIMAGLN